MTKYDVLFDVVILMAVLSVFGHTIVPLVILFLICLGIFASLKLLNYLDAAAKSHSFSRNRTAAPPITPHKTTPQSQYGVFLSDITNQLTQDYPGAKWLWADPTNAYRLVMAGEQVKILIRNVPMCSALVRMDRTTNRLLDIRYEQTEKAETDFDNTKDTGKETEPEPQEDCDYSLQAFSWVESNMTVLTQKIIGLTAFDYHYCQLMPDELPEQETWSAITDELCRNHIDAELLPGDAGIMLTF